MKKFDHEEKEIVDAFQAGKLNSVSHLKAEMKLHREYAAATLQMVEEKKFLASSQAQRLT